MITQPSRRAHTKVPHYWLGLGVGLIPLVPALIALGMYAFPTLIQPGDADPALFLLALVLYSIESIATIVTLVIKRVRFVGFGLLTMVLISPLLFVIGVVLSLKLNPPSFFCD